MIDSTIMYLEDWLDLVLLVHEQDLTQHRPQQPHVGFGHLGKLYDPKHGYRLTPLS